MQCVLKLLLLLLLMAFIQCRIAQGPQVCYAHSGSVYCLYTIYTLVDVIRCILSSLHLAVKTLLPRALVEGGKKSKLLKLFNFF